MLDEVDVLYRGLVLGLVIAAPVGPVGLLCIRRTLQKGMLIGLSTGLGAACADAIFATIAVLGISAVFNFIHHYEAYIRILGGIIVLVSAWHTSRDTPKPPNPREIIARVLNLTQEKVLLGTVRALFSGFIITLTNPLTLFGTLAIVATFGGINEGLQAGVLITSIFVGSVIWWCFLASSVSLLCRHFTENRIMTLNRFTALILALLAVWAIVSGIQEFITPSALSS